MATNLTHSLNSFGSLGLVRSCFIKNDCRTISLRSAQLNAVEFDNGQKHDWLQMRPMIKRNLDELYAGACDAMTYKEVSE